MRLWIVAVALLLSFSSAQAAPRHHHHHRHHHVVRIARHHAQFDHIGDVFVHAAQQVSESRPADCYGIPWCGCYMRHIMGVADRAYNLARNWAHYGVAARGPRIGVIVVWRHHVGRIEGYDSIRREWVVNSGNDGHRIRTRPRSLAGAIAFRYSPHHGDWGAF